MKTALKTSAAAAALAVAFAPVAEAGKVANGAKAIDLKIYGQVNRVTAFVNDGSESDVFHADNEASSTRIGLDGAGKVNEDISAKTKIEFEGLSTSFDSVSFGNHGSNAGFVLRHARLQLASKKFGTLTMGHTSEASDGRADPSYWGVGNILSGAGKGDLGGSFGFRTDNGALSGTTVSDVMVKLDGGRDDVIRYDLPTFAGLSVAVSHSSGDSFNTGAKYVNKFGDFDFTGSVGYNSSTGGNVDYDISGGLAIKHTSGLSGSFAAGTRELKSGNNQDPFYVYGNVGYDTKLIDAGTTSFGADFYYSEDFGAAGNEGTGFGVAVDQKLAGGAAQIGLGFQYQDVDLASNVNTDEIYIVMMASRVKF